MVVSMRRFPLGLLAAALFALASCKGLQHGGTSTVEIFPPAGVDHLEMAVTVDVEIAGIGKDTLSLKGSAAVHRTGPMGAGGKEIRGELIGATFHGKSSVFGEVYASQNPLKASSVAYTWVGPGQYRGTLDINGWFWLPEHNLLVYGGAPVHVEGPATAIPPVGQKADSTGAEVPLFDLHKPQGNPIGSISKAHGEVTGVAAVSGG
jgi:hypothetical protein